MSFLMLLQIPLKFWQMCKNSPAIISGTPQFFIRRVNNAWGRWNCLWSLTLRLTGRQAWCAIVCFYPYKVRPRDVSITCCKDISSVPSAYPPCVPAVPGARHWCPAHRPPTSHQTYTRRVSHSVQSAALILDIFHTLNSIHCSVWIMSSLVETSRAGSKKSSQMLSYLNKI